MGESARKAVYFRLEKDYTLAREEIAGNPEALAEGLERIFGAGAQVVESSILKSLYSNLGLKCEETVDLNFVQAVKRARIAWLRGNEVQKQYLQKLS